MADKKNNEQIITVLDVGASSLVSLVGVLGSEGGIEIIGRGISASGGIHNGNIIDEKTLAFNMNYCLHQAESSSNTEISNVFVGFSGDHIRGVNSRGSVVLNPQKPIKPGDLQRAIDSASFVPVLPEQKLVHVLPQKYFVEDLGIVRDPVGQKGSRLEIDAHAILAGSREIARLKRTVSRANYNVENIILSCVGSSYVVSAMENCNSCLVVNIGSSTTDLLIFADGLHVYTRSINCGGEAISEEIARSFYITFLDAEELKMSRGCAKPALLGAEEAKHKTELNRNGGAGKIVISRAEIARKIDAVVTEQIKQIRVEADKSGYNHHIKQIILTGGGALLSGLAEKFEDHFRLPVNTAMPKISGPFADEINNPLFTDAYGMLCYASSLRMQNKVMFANVKWVPMWIKKGLGWINEKF